MLIGAVRMALMVASSFALLGLLMGAEEECVEGEGLSVGR
jgi:hypothetical protein